MGTLVHQVRIGHTTATVLESVAICSACKWRADLGPDGAHVRELAVAHAQLEGHGVTFGELARTVTNIEVTS